MTANIKKGVGFLKALFLAFDCFYSISMSQQIAAQINLYYLLVIHACWLKTGKSLENLRYKFKYEIECFTQLDEAIN